MSKVGALLLTSSLLLIPQSPASAATKPTLVKTAFQKLLNVTADSMDSLEQKYEADVDALDVALSTATNLANQTYDQELLAATNLFSPQITAANKKVEDAKILFSANNKIKILRSLFDDPNRDRVYPHFICPETTLPYGADWLEIAKSSCNNFYGRPRPGDVSTKINSKGGTVGGGNWEPNEIAEILYTSASDRYIQLAISNGSITAVNLVAFDSSRLTITSETNNAADLVQRNGKARDAALGKRDRAVATATSIRSDALEDLDSAQEAAKDALAAQETAASLGLLASKRAKKDPNSFDKAFAVAYKFEYNRQMVNEIADASWSGEWTFRTIDSIIKVSRLANTGDAIAAKYSTRSGSAFNSVVGNAFTNEPDFRASLKVLVKIYQKTTKTVLKV